MPSAHSSSGGTHVVTMGRGIKRDGTCTSFVDAKSGWMPFSYHLCLVDLGVGRRGKVESYQRQDRTSLTTMPPPMTK